jgi:glucosamine 6-phosphate synthetase-like amidotransferase/phosphosugar isomerase protein
MCGIFGSNKLERFRTLYTLNLGRGDFAYGGIYDYEEGFMVEKAPGQHKIKNKHKKCDYLLGHTQAPTSVVREFDADTSHPFKYKDWCVAHNGVLTNAEDVQKRFLLKGTNDVDSSVIPSLISHNHINTGNPHKDEIRAITVALEHLDGTYACWIVNNKTKNKYLARVGSTLYGELSSGDFSSARVPQSTFTSLKEGILYKIDSKIHSVGKFTFNSPFFIL